MEAEWNELTERVRNEVGRLPRQQAEAFWMQCVEQMSQMVPAAAVLAITLGTGILILTSTPRHGAGAAFAEVQQAIGSSGSVRFQVLTFVGGDDPTVTTVVFQEPGRYRVELPSGDVVVEDFEGKERMRVSHLEGKSIREVMTDFVFDGSHDDSLFRIVPPKGYAVTRRARGEPNPPDPTTLIVSPETGIGPVKFGMSIDEVVRALGEPNWRKEHRFANNFNPALEVELQKDGSVRVRPGRSRNQTERGLYSVPAACRAREHAYPDGTEPVPRLGGRAS